MLLATRPQQIVIVLLQIWIIEKNIDLFAAVTMYIYERSFISLIKSDIKLKREGNFGIKRWQLSVFANQSKVGFNIDVGIVNINIESDTLLFRIATLRQISENSGLNLCKINVTL